MVFFEKIPHRVVTREDLVSADFPHSEKEFLSQVQTDSNGEFISGVSAGRSVMDQYEIMSEFPILDVKAGSLYDAIVEYVQSNFCKRGREFDAFCSWVKPQIEVLEVGWRNAYQEVADQYARERKHLRSWDDLERDSKLLVFLQNMKEYWQALQKYEHLQFLWSGEFVAYITYDTRLIDNEYETCFSLTTVQEAKKYVESHYLNDEHNMWFNAVHSRFRMVNVNNYAWLYLCEFMRSIGNLLQAMILKKSDFYENPIHCLMGMVYNPSEVDARVGSEIVSKIIEVAREFDNCRYFGIAGAVDEVIKMKDEITKIKDQSVRGYANIAVDLLTQNYWVIHNYTVCWDAWLTSYFRNIDASAMAKYG